MGPRSLLLVCVWRPIISTKSIAFTIIRQLSTTLFALQHYFFFIQVRFFIQTPHVVQAIRPVVCMGTETQTICTTLIGKLAASCVRGMSLCGQDTVRGGNSLPMHMLCSGVSCHGSFFFLHKAAIVLQQNESISGSKYTL